LVFDADIARKGLKHRVGVDNGIHSAGEKAQREPSQRLDRSQAQHLCDSRKMNRDRHSARQRRPSFDADALIRVGTTSPSRIKATIRKVSTGGVNRLLGLALGHNATVWDEISFARFEQSDGFYEVWSNLVSNCQIQLFGEMVQNVDCKSGWIAILVQTVLRRPIGRDGCNNFGA
jgi:hypothetical protein